MPELAGVSVTGVGLLPGSATLAALEPPVAAVPSVPVIPKTDQKAAQATPLKVGGKIQSAKLIRHPAPAYPAIAKMARVQGDVILQAVIAKDGSIRDLKLQSAASPLLVNAAMDAVKRWLYQPTLLNGEPVEVLTEITITFSLQ